MYNIEYRPTGEHGNADGLSRLPLTMEPVSANPDDATIFNVMQMDTLPVKSSEIMAATRTDPILSKVLYCFRTDGRRSYQTRSFHLGVGERN